MYVPPIRNTFLFLFFLLLLFFYPVFLSLGDNSTASLSKDGAKLAVMRQLRNSKF